MGDNQNSISSGSHIIPEESKIHILDNAKHIYFIYSLKKKEIQYIIFKLEYERKK